MSLNPKCLKECKMLVANCLWKPVSIMGFGPLTISQPWRAAVFEGRDGLILMSPQLNKAGII